MSVHARISDPLDLRKDILESAIVSTDALGYAERLNEFAREKKKLRTQMKNSLNDLKKRVKIFDKKLPKLPEEERLHAHKQEMGELLQEQMKEEMGGEVKNVEQVRKEIERIKNRDPKKLKKNVERVNEKEKMRREF